MNPIFPHDVVTFTDTLQAKLGQIFNRGDGTRWQYVEFDTGTGGTFEGGAFCQWTDRDAFKVSTDLTDVTDNPAGAIAATKRLDDDGNASTDRFPTDGQYGFIQIEGYHPAVRKAPADDGMTEGELVILAATDGDVTMAVAADPALAELNKMVGRAAGASEDTAAGTYMEDTVPVNIKIAL